MHIKTAILCLLFLLATSEVLPLTWDEGESIDRANKITAWFRAARPLSYDSIREHWIFTTQIEGHPAGYGIVIAAGHAVAKFVLPPKTAYRFGPMFLFAVALGAVFRRVEKNIGFQAALFAVLAILLTPRLFAHAHIAACDSTLTACWLLAWACFDLKTARRTLFWGFLLGLTLSAKFTGWIAIVPFFLSLFFQKDDIVLQKRLLRFSCGLAVALLTFFLLNPPLWLDPIHGFVRFFTLNTTRENFNISILFLGRMYNLDHPLPWYNTIVWTAITVPAGFLFLLFYAVITSSLPAFYSLVLYLKRLENIFLGLTTPAPQEETTPTPPEEGNCSSPPLEGCPIGRGGLSPNEHFFPVYSLCLVFHACSLLVVRAIPGTPPHDGVRLFVTAFAFLAILAGIGAGALADVRLRRVRVGFCAVILIYGTALFNLYWYAPQWLSYYNAAIGGLSGAAHAGMEPTYYWDALDNEVADWLEANTRPDEMVLFSASSAKTLLLKKQWGELRTDFYRKNAKDQKGKTIRYYILQRRPSGEYPADQRLIRQAKPVYVKTIRGFDKVPILEIYEFQDYLKARHRSQTGS